MLSIILVMYVKLHFFLLTLLCYCMWFFFVVEKSLVDFVAELHVLNVLVYCFALQFFFSFFLLKMDRCSLCVLFFLDALNWQGF